MHETRSRGEPRRRVRRWSVTWASAVTVPPTPVFAAAPMPVRVATSPPCRFVTMSTDSLCVIPARGGSTRIPRKNIKPFHGKPVIVWSIEAALLSGCFSRVVVSTDDEEIALVAREAGAEVPFLRPSSLADAHTTLVEVTRHALEWFWRRGSRPDTVCQLMATAPFVSAEDLRSAGGSLGDADYALTVTEYAFPVQRAVRITDRNRLEMFSPEHFETRSQDLERAYHDAGQFCLGTASAWLARRVPFGTGTVPIVLPASRVQDIDTPEQWRQAERLFGLMRDTEEARSSADRFPRQEMPGDDLRAA